MSPNIPIIMWDSDVRYGWLWVDRDSAEKTLDAIKKYTAGRGFYTVEQMSMEEYKKLYIKFANAE